MVNDKIVLDDEAEKLFREIEGIDSARDLESFSDIADLLSDCLQAEEERLDKWRVHLVEAAHLISSFFVEARFQDGVKKKKNA